MIGPPWRRFRTRGPRPGWWPASEPWPPTGAPYRLRRGFLWRTGFLAAGALLIATVGVIVIVWHLATALGLPAGGAGGIAFIAAVALLAAGVAAIAARAVRRFAVPFGDLIEAAGRVEEGDLAARVPEPATGPPPVRALVRAFNGMAARLESDERRRRSLLADVGHELRTPLAVLQGDLEAMADGVHPPDATHLRAALDETHVLERLLEDLRTLANAEAGALALHREPTDAGVLVDEAARSLEPLAAARGVTIDVQTSADLPLVDLDPVRIREVLTNLIDNAIRFGPPGTAVTVEAGLHPGERMLAISVSDRGPGIPAELLPNVFERFAKSPRSSGSGLGLAIARRLVDAHGGRIGIESPPESGTTVRFELPLGPDAD